MKIRRIETGCILAVLFTQAVLTMAQERQAVLLPGTMLRVTLPPGWRLDPPRLPPQLHTLTSTSAPRYEMWVSQTNPQTVGHSCMSFIGSMQAATARLSPTIRPRPPFVPDVYVGAILDTTTSQLVCLSAGDSETAVMIQPVEGNSKPEVLTPMLAAIADAALKQSGATSSPSRLRLPVLRIEIPLRSGSWGVRTITDTWGTVDLLGRSSRPGGNELNVTPFIFKAPGRCENLGTTSPFGSSNSVTFVKERRYGGDRWRPGAWEQFPPPFKALEAYACRNVGQNSILLARIEYEKTTVPDSDLSDIRQMLDDIGDAVDQSISGGPAGPTPAPTFFSMEPAILSDTQGYDFGRYLNAVIAKVRQSWYAVMPEVARKGEVGRAVVVFDIVRDGKADNSRLVQGSGNQVLDRGALSAIQLSSPFAALPVDFKGDRLVLRLTFQYNLRP